jgi:hypothetical protein
MKQYDTGRHQSHQDKEASSCMLKPSYLKLFVPGPLLTDLAGTTITNKNEFESRNILLASCFCHLQEKQALGRARSEFCDVIYVDVT